MGSLNQKGNWNKKIPDFSANDCKKSEHFHFCFTYSVEEHKVLSNIIQCSATIYIS